MASVTSSCSVESDWSDEEVEELEKIFGHIQVNHFDRVILYNSLLKDIFSTYL